MWNAYRGSEGPVWCPDTDTGGFWSVFDYATALEVLRDPARFTSHSGIRLVHPAEDLSHVRDRMLVVSDGEAHRRLRRPHHELLEPARLANTIDDLRHTLSRQIDQLCETGETFDLMRAIAWPATIIVTRALGFAAELHDQLQQAVRAGFDEEDAIRAVEGRVSLFGTAVDQVLRGEALEPWADLDEAVLNVVGILNGGLETTPHAVATAAILLTEGVLQPGLPPDREHVVEEITRLSSPAMHTMRTAAVGTWLRQARINAGDRIVIWLPACNRDPAAFEAPDQFRLGRPRSLAFGFGPHFCIGHLLARLELDTVIQVMMAAPGQIELVEAPERRASTFVNGYDRLVLRFRPADCAS